METEGHSGLLAPSSANVLAMAVPGMLPKVAVYRQMNIPRDEMEITIFFRVGTEEKSTKYRCDLSVPSELLEAVYHSDVNAEYFIMGMVFERLRLGAYKVATEAMIESNETWKAHVE